MSMMASQNTSLTIVYSTIYSGADQRKGQSSTSLAIVRGIHWWPVNSPFNVPVTRKLFPFDDVIMENISICSNAMTAKEHKSDFKLTKDSPYLILTDKLWGIYCEDLKKN